jgi:hypothetical protein
MVAVYNQIISSQIKVLLSLIAVWEFFVPNNLGFINDNFLYIFVNQIVIAPYVIYLLACSSIVKVKTICSSEKSVDFQCTVQHYVGFEVLSSGYEDFCLLVFNRLQDI